METYVLKTILCSSVFIGFYYLILERQKAHQFKRFYLLFSMLFSMLIPFLSITYGVAKPIENDFIFIENSDAVFVPVVEETSVFTLENSIYTLYFIVTLVLFTSFLISLNALRKEIDSGKKIKRGNCFLVLKEEKSTAHSFWKYIFLNKTDFENGKIDDKIIRHEEAHLQQKHSFDVLFMEFLLTIFWFNPAFYLYKKAMITNHEFLADEAVLKNENDIKSYQKLLLTELISERILFTNPFNLSNTKKRIKMMTTPKNNKSKLFPWLSLPLAGVVFFAFVEKVPAQLENQNKADTAVPEISTITKDGGKMSGGKWEDALLTSENRQTKTTENTFEEFQKILSKYSNLLNEKKYLEFGEKLTNEDKKKLNELFPLLTKEQKELVPILIFDKKGKLEKNTIVDSELKQYLDSKKYGIWIDGKRVPNSVLRNYKASDFSSVMSSVIHKNTVDYGKYKYHVSMLTHPYFEKINKESKIQVGIKTTYINANKLKLDTIKPKPNQKQELPPPPPPVETPAEFPGGMNALRKKIMENTDTSKLKPIKGTYKGIVHIMVLEDGSDADTFLEFEDKEFMNVIGDAVQKTIKGVKWKPGTKYGKPSNSHLKIPITMNFE